MIEANEKTTIKMLLPTVPRPRENPVPDLSHPHSDMHVGTSHARDPRPLASTPSASSCRASDAVPHGTTRDEARVSEDSKQDLRQAFVLTPHKPPVPRNSCPSKPSASAPSDALAPLLPRPSTITVASPISYLQNPHPHPIGAPGSKGTQCRWGGGSKQLPLFQRCCNVVTTLS